MAQCEVYSTREIARAAGVPVKAVARELDRWPALAATGYVPASRAAALVRHLRGGPADRARSRAPLTLPAESRRKQGTPLVLSGLVHGLFVAALLLASSIGLLTANDTDQQIVEPTPVRLVYMMAPGPGGGGGGGGLKAPAPAVRIAVKAPAPKPAVRTPMPPRRPPTPPTPAPVIPAPPKPVVPVMPMPVAPRPDPLPTIQAAVVPRASDLFNRVGVLSAPPAPAPPSHGPGSGGGAGTGSGTGLGPGDGSGLGDGSGGGMGGGPFRAGNGIDPPGVLREVQPLYTDEARRRAIEGDVVLEVVVKRDGSVGSVRVVRTLGAGLEQKAIDAVRQWRFSPAKRRGSPVDVLVEVAVGFTLR